jgi:hypothetical protein
VNTHVNNDSFIDTDIILYCIIFFVKLAKFVGKISFAKGQLGAPKQHIASKMILRSKFL